ncbi:MAG: tetratricopeptide repeat protein [Rhodobacteraceae bacterium]|jgi:tetratricopeptide (TPR) repeat protein|nr:tetratricopeptide repeat protein [Paracoccaceae bacterium]
MRAHRPVLSLSLVLIAALALAACDTTGGLNRPDGVNAPGVDRRGQGVDGLTVGHRLMAAGEYDSALDAYYRAAAERGVTVDTLSAIGSAQLMLGRLNQAEKTLRDAIALDDSFAPAWNNLGVVLMEQGRIGEAERSFRNAFALDSGNTAEIRDNLARAMEQLADPGYAPPEDSRFALVRRGGGDFLLRPVP